MRHRWYGDLRDLLKWTVVADAVKSYGIRSVVYVSYLPEDPERGKVHPAVWKHFRPVNSVESLVRDLGATLVPMPPDFSHRRRASYLEAAVEVVRRASQRRLVLLDPDTGFQPARATSAHTTHAEVATLWERLDDGDWLALYQHAWRQGSWRATAARRLQAILPGTPNVQCDYRPDIAKDVAILVAQKEVAPTEASELKAAGSK